MSLKDTIKKNGKEEGQKLKNMSWKDRFWYIWEYYKVHFLGLIIFCLVIYLIGTILYNQTFEDRLYYAVINNASPSSTDFESFNQEFKDAMGYGKKDRVTGDSSVFLNFDDAGSQTDYAYMVKISAMVSGRELDMIITDESTFKHYAASDAFLNLEEVLPEDLQEQLQDQILYAANGSGEEIPCGLNISNTRFPEATGVSITPNCYMGIVSNTARLDTVIAWIRFILND